MIRALNNYVTVLLVTLHRINGNEQEYVDKEFRKFI